MSATISPDDLLRRRVRELEVVVAGGQMHCAMVERDLEATRQDLERSRAAHDEACSLVADMHSAAVGAECGPKRGVLEDVVDLRVERDEAKHKAGLLTELLGGLRVELAMATNNRDGWREQSDRLSVELGNVRRELAEAVADAKKWADYSMRTGREMDTWKADALLLQGLVGEKNAELAELKGERWARLRAEELLARTAASRDRATAELGNVHWELVSARKEISRVGQWVSAGFYAVRPGEAGECDELVGLPVAVVADGCQHADTVAVSMPAVGCWGIRCCECGKVRGMAGEWV